MLALRLARGAHSLVQLRRLLVAAASAGTGFLLLCTLGYALAHPDPSAGALLRLLWCLAPAAATVHFAVAVARTDPGTRPRPGLSAVGLGPGQLMAISAVTTALSTTLGSVLALLVFLHLRGDLPGRPFDGDPAAFLASDHPLPLPAALTLLLLVPLAASSASAVALRPRGARPSRPRRPGADGDSPRERSRRRAESGPYADQAGHPLDPQQPAPPLPTPGGLPWGTAVLAAGLAVEAYASRSGPGLVLPGRFTGGPARVFGGWSLTALGLMLAAPAITHLCGWLLQAVRPGVLRLLAGRVLQEEARRIGRPLGVVCAVTSGAYAMATVYSGARPSFGPLSMLGALLVAGCTVATLLTAAVEAKHARADTTAALLRMGAPTTVLRGAALLRAGALLAAFGPLTWVVAELAAVPLVR
ncbi:MULTISPECIES: hypothetical protein [unclassified Streptomyces]|uniref:hypothetical protein n=1 Tax=unclassified Streptomyces TaxID=2593676 RepID=UPI0011643DDB|nr:MULTISPECIES: hypothetical protein [unclassified Streptomyces]QDN60440.1 hypothetical protein FNV67_38720 [Streptomyces sp. S1D4-20]QDN70495.1 hypothetical protein FNV66_37580 [Streptomyces sp. S1D4-14]QDO52950.1 hypothetical protein FNV60_36065 [Streptomyces sp. RLB3-5]QDO63193.1 hypothetical protein FNV59_38315 [Streptomyces sp. RLB1-8]